MTFGDLEPDDVYDPAPADPEQVARRLHELRRLDGFEVQRWDDLTPGARVALVAIVAALLGWLRRQGAT